MGINRNPRDTYYLYRSLEFTYYDGATEVIPISLTLGVLSSAVPLFPEIKVVNENAQYITNLVNQEMMLILYKKY